MNRPIKACEVLPGDTVRYESSNYGIERTETYTVNAVRFDGSFAVFQIKGGADRALLGHDELTLLDRPAPQLPTEWGSLIVAADERDQEPHLNLVLCDDGDWWDLVHCCRWTQADIFAWLPATVTTKETGS